jgi:predicted DNA binding CopG/RHH family protein
MFTHLLYNDNNLFTVKFSDYAVNHYIKRFEKDYSEKQWDITVESIFQDLARIKTSDSDLQRTQQVDELWHKASYWILKYDFRVAQTKESTKSSGNRCVAFLDNVANKIEILVIYGKSDLPKNIGEQAFIEQTLIKEFRDYMVLVR